MQKATVGTDVPQFLPVAGRHQPAPFYLTADTFGGMPVDLAGGEITSKVGKPVADPHKHEVDEVCLLVSPNPGGARIEVLVDGERHELSSPTVLHIPAGAKHRFVNLTANRPAQAAALVALADQAHLARVRGENARNRDWFCLELAARTYPR